MYPIFGELQQIGYLCGGMRYLVKILAVLFAVIFVSCQAEYDYKPMQDKTSLVHVGDAAPDFTVNLLSGQSVSLSKYRDRVVMVVFFTTTDVDSRKYLSFLDALNRQFADNNFSLLAVAVGEDKTAVKAFIEEKGYKFDVALDIHMGIYSLYATDYLPRTFIVDPLGRIAALSAGCDSKEFDMLVDVIRLLVTQ